MEYVNLAAVLWLAFYTIATVVIVQSSADTGTRIQRVNVIPTILAIASLITVGIHIIGDLP